jgi:hypothetical protein
MIRFLFPERDLRNPDKNAGKNLKYITKRLVKESKK